MLLVALLCFAVPSAISYLYCLTSLSHTTPKPPNTHCTGAYELIKSKGFVPYDTCQPYLACSSESTDGFCKEIDTTCTAANTCRTCGHFGDCAEIDVFPNATVAEYGSYSIFSSDKTHKIMAEIYARGPVAAGTFGGGRAFGEGCFRLFACLLACIYLMAAVVDCGSESSSVIVALSVLCIYSLYYNLSSENTSPSQASTPNPS